MSKPRCITWDLAATRILDALSSPEANKAVADLTEFLTGTDGRNAIHCLLNFTGRHIVFAEVIEVHPVIPRTVYALTKVGLVKTGASSTLPGGFPETIPISAAEIVGATIQFGNTKPEQIMPWLLAELDTIAAETLP
ncbi:MAG: hypothetical protein ACD_81C00130G0001 [uncultured bacterium]|uniref:Uncharacterized protein n=2 Tax=Candidatus Wolfeibacteriota TaxID=1752735 RepID=A0A0G1K519_9BACT|nr:MAG: hypothetical protein ACD_81C00130G0001 [uncultured bacterium]KKR12122.1 MAG: hypothetical protein UT41_C0003G0049 [Candidatus Wolfebacteria bacterium GW2011_GWC2_39_22]KKT42944.1 MAG: hypothetical protein UW32_C0003G0047 [Candidatus Wolfebacteria bacterium GW2011_GWE2_44_13]HBI25257.1 hypothetical protein [Candidatus Wolfebacteria bacterium]